MTFFIHKNQINIKYYYDITKFVALNIYFMYFFALNNYFNITKNEDLPIFLTNFFLKTFYFLFLIFRQNLFFIKVHYF